MGFLEIFIYFIIIMIKIFLFILLFYILIKSFKVKENFALSEKNKNINNEIKVLTYNVQRLPYLIRPKVDIKKLMNKYDIVCLQENFCNIIGSNKSTFGYNCICPGGSIFKLVDSGLSIYSKYHINYIDFVRFNNLKSVDKLSDKGFLIVEINGIIFINTHLQATYNLKNNNFEESNEQLNQIFNYVKKYNKVVICGDINMNIQEFKFDDYKNICPPYPTHWSKMESFISSTSAIERKGFLPYYYDGGFYKNVVIENISCVKEDEFTDHLGVHFKVN